MFSKEEKTEWTRIRIRMIELCQEDLKEVGRLKTLEIEKEILEDAKIMYQDRIVLKLTDKQIEEIKEILEKNKRGDSHACTVHQTKPEDLPR